MDIIATSAFGIESVTARELKQLGYETKTENGRVLFSGTEADVARANLWLRTSDRILIRFASFEALSFEDLYQGVYAVEWADLLPEDAFIHVLGNSVDSVLHSVPDCQSVAKKAIIEKMKMRYRREVFAESGTEYKILISILKNAVTVAVDTSGAGLHKRGYRALAGEAPIKETLACAMLLLSFWKGNRTLVDPLCGSGTIPIEAAMIASDRAPGLKRGFACEAWHTFSPEVFRLAREEARDRFLPDAETDISGSDLDPKAVELAQLHAEAADMDGFVRIKQMNVRDLSSRKKYGFILTNPPYAHRLGESREVEALYRDMGKVFCNLDTWSYSVITPVQNFERLFGRKADKRRKLYNGRLECQLYQFYGPRPPKDEK